MGESPDMDEQNPSDVADILRDIRADQREIVALLREQQELARSQLESSKERLDESMALQRLAMDRQKHITLIAVPGILTCIAAIAYLVWRYF